MTTRNSSSTSRRKSPLIVVLSSSNYNGNNVDVDDDDDDIHNDDYDLNHKNKQQQGQQQKQHEYQHHVRDINSSNNDAVHYNDQTQQQQQHDDNDDDMEFISQQQEQQSTGATTTTTTLTNTRSIDTNNHHHHHHTKKSSIRSRKRRIYNLIDSLIGHYNQSIHSNIEQQEDFQFFVQQHIKRHEIFIINSSNRNHICNNRQKENVVTNNNDYSLPNIVQYYLQQILLIQKEEVEDYQQQQSSSISSNDNNILNELLGCYLTKVHPILLVAEGSSTTKNIIIPNGCSISVLIHYEMLIYEYYFNHIATKYDENHRNHDQKVENDYYNNNNSVFLSTEQQEEELIVIIMNTIEVLVCDITTTTSCEIKISITDNNNNKDDVTSTLRQNVILPSLLRLLFFMMEHIIILLHQKSCCNLTTNQKYHQSSNNNINNNNNDCESIHKNKIPCKYDNKNNHNKHRLFNDIIPRCLCTLLTFSKIKSNNSNDNNDDNNDNYKNNNTEVGKQQQQQQKLKNGVRNHSEDQPILDMLLLKFKNLSQYLVYYEHPKSCLSSTSSSSDDEDVTATYNNDNKNNVMNITIHLLFDKEVYLLPIGFRWSDNNTSNNENDMGVSTSVYDTIEMICKGLYNFFNRTVVRQRLQQQQQQSNDQIPQEQQQPLTISDDDGSITPSSSSSYSWMERLLFFIMEQQPGESNINKKRNDDSGLILSSMGTIAKAIRSHFFGHDISLLNMKHKQLATTKTTTTTRLHLGKTIVTDKNNVQDNVIGGRPYETVPARLVTTVRFFTLLSKWQQHQKHQQYDRTRFIHNEHTTILNELLPICYELLGSSNDSIIGIGSVCLYHLLQYFCCGGCWNYEKKGYAMAAGSQDLRFISFSVLNLPEDIIIMNLLTVLYDTIKVCRNGLTLTLLGITQQFLFHILLHNEQQVIATSPSFLVGNNKKLYENIQLYKNKRRLATQQWLLILDRNRHSTDSSLILGLLLGVLPLFLQHSNDSSPTDALELGRPGLAALLPIIRHDDGYFGLAESTPISRGAADEDMDDLSFPTDTTSKSESSSNTLKIKATCIQLVAVMALSNLFIAAYPIMPGHAGKIMCELLACVRYTELSITHDKKYLSRIVEREQKRFNDNEAIRQTNLKHQLIKLVEHATALAIVICGESASGVLNSIRTGDIYDEAMIVLIDKLLLQSDGIVRRQKQEEEENFVTDL